MRWISHNESIVLLFSEWQEKNITAFLKTIRLTYQGIYFEAKAPFLFTEWLKNP